MNCEADVKYLFEQSADLEHWIPVVTNFSFGVQNTTSIEATGAQPYDRVSRGPVPLLRFAILTSEAIDLNGRDFAADSSDSSEPQHSTNARYDPAKSKANGMIAAQLGLTNS